MRVSTNFKITMSHQSRACYVDQFHNPPPEYPSVKEDQIDALTEKLKAAGLEVDRKKSEKKYENEQTEIAANFDETAKGSLKELVFVSYNGIEITIDNYSRHHSDGRMGGVSNNINGIEAHLVYEGSSQEQGEQLLDKAKKVINDFYKPMCQARFPEHSEKINFKKRASLDDYGKPEK